MTNGTTQPPTTTVHYLESLSALAAQRFASTDELIRIVLTLISSQLGLRTSFLTRIYPEHNINHIVAAINQADGCDVLADVDLPLHETYCSVLADTQLAQPLIINDTHNDPTFHTHPAAAASPQIASFIGVPIILSNGDFYGTLCAVDREVQSLTPQQADLLMVLGRIIATQIERDHELEARQRAENELARLYQMSQAMVREREALLSIASHEIKNPLGALIGYTSLLKRRVKRDQSLNERDQKTLNAIGIQADRINAMLNNLLDISHLDDGQIVLDKAPFDLVALIQRLIQEHQSTLTRHTMAFACPLESLTINADQARIEQVLRNLLTNAIKYSPNGGAVQISLTNTDTTATIAVQDHGIGIPANAMAELFQRFYRAPNSSKNNINGFGIGLYVVREIVAMHGGSVHVASVEDQGSTFTVSLPLDQPSDAL